MLGTRVTSESQLQTMTVPQAAEALIDEKRTAPRTPERLGVHLTGLGCSDGHSCMVEDISVSGVYVRVPTGYGMTVGQRFEVGFANEIDAPELGCIAGEVCYATVVRTETGAMFAASAIS